MLAGLTVSNPPTKPEKESCLCVPQDGDRPGSHDINPPLGPSPALSKVLKSMVEPDPQPQAGDSSIQLRGGWGSVIEISRDLFLGVTHNEGRIPLFSEWLVRTLAGKSESPWEGNLIRDHKLPLHRLPNS